MINSLLNASINVERMTMQERFKAGKNKRTIIVMFISVAIHVLAFLLIVPFISFDDPPPPAEDKNLEVRVMNDDDFQKILELKKRKKKKKPKPKPIVKKPEEKKPVIPFEPTKNRKAVEQDTNRVRPKVASYVSEEDNKVAEQTRARKTKDADKPSNKEEKAAPSKPNQEPQEAEKEASKVGQTLNPEADKPKPIEGLVRKQDPVKKFGNPFQKPSLTEASRVLAKPGFSKRKMESRAGRKFMKNYEKNDKALKASLENFIPEVKPGNHTGVNSHKNIGAGYLSHIHRKIHPLWASNYLIKLDLYEPISSELNDPKLGTKLEFVIDGKTGEVEKINIVRSSGALRFDAEAIAIGHQVGPHRKAPSGIVSPNGKVYIHWNFWRNQRQCGTFGASIFLLNKDA